MFIYYLLIITSISCIHPLFADFENLEKIRNYANQYPEFPKSDDDNWLNPSYFSFYKKTEITFLSNLLLQLGIIQRTWTPANFVTMLKKLVDEREILGFSGRKVARITATPETKVFVWGDMHGAFHSLVRCLEFLKKENIITNDLRIVNPNHYFVFNGDNIDRSPYSMETLTVVFHLLTNNHEQVFVIRGKHEDKNHWYNYGLKEELKLRLRYLSDNPIPFSSLMSRFFNTLPLALYVNSAENPQDLIRISHFGRGKKEINEKQMGTFFSKKQDEKVLYYDVTKKEKTDIDVDVKVIITTENWRKENRTQSGIGLLDQDRGATAWSVLSSPIMVHRRYLDFHYDAFAVINTASPLMMSTITLFNHDIDTNKDFVKHPSLYIKTGSTIPPDLSKPDFVIGSSLALIGGVPIMGERTKRGMAVKINQINKEGGVKGHFLKMIVYNDDYSPRKARKNIIKLIEKDKADIILLPTGSPTLASYLDLIRENKTLVLFPITGGPQFRKEDLIGLVHFRSTYADEVKALTDIIIKEYSAKNFTLFYQDDAYGIGPMQAAQRVLESYKLKKGEEVPYHRANVNFESQAEKIRLSNADSLGLFSAASPTIEMIRQLGIQNLIDKQVFGISFLGEESVRRYAKDHGIDILFGAVVPNPWLNERDIVKEYRDQMNKNNYMYDVFSLEAYIGSSILINVLENIDEPFTKDTVRQKLESFNMYQFKGLTLTFDPQRRDLFDSVWIEMGKDKKWIEKKVK